MRYSRYCHAILVAILTLTLGCAAYNASSLSRLDASFAPYAEEIDQVNLAARKLTVADTKKYLDRDVIAKGYQPVQLSIDNQSNMHIVFSPNRVSLPCARPEEVAQKVHTSTAGRILAWGIPGLFIWPFLIPAVVDGIGSSNANKKLDADFAAKSFGETVVQPKSFHEGLIFVPTASFTESFTVTLMDRDTKDTMPFQVTAK